MHQAQNIPEEERQLGVGAVSTCSGRAEKNGRAVIVVGVCRGPHTAMEDHDLVESADRSALHGQVGAFRARWGIGSSDTNDISRERECRRSGKFALTVIAEDFLQVGPGIRVAM